VRLAGTRLLRNSVIASITLVVAAAAAPPPPAASQANDPDDIYALPALRPPSGEPNAHRLATTPQGHTPIVAALAHPSGKLHVPPEDEATREAAELRAAMASEVAHLLKPSPAAVADAALRASTLLGQSGQVLDRPQIVVVVDRNPRVETLYLMLARPGGPNGWRLVGAAHVSTGQAGRKDYYITPVGVFAHTDAILDFRAQGTFNEHHVRGLGLAGMRVWDFGWQWALKGWHTDGAGGDIRLQMHATDPKLLEGRLGRPASEGCVRVSSTMNRFLDKYGVLDADYELMAVTDGRYANLLRSDRTPTPLSGRLLVVIDTAAPVDAPPTAASRPANWPAPGVVTPDGTQPGTDNSATP
jgi:hypothetical protein